MKRTIATLLALALVFGLCGCKNRNEERFEAFADALRARDDVSLTAVVRVEYPESTSSFTLRCADEGGGYCVEVLEPELIRGVRAHLRKGETTLSFEGVEIDAGDDGGTGLTPMGALPLLLGALRDGWVDSVWKEDSGLAVKLIPQDEVSVTVFFDADMDPLRAELAHGGSTVVFCEITEFS